MNTTGHSNSLNRREGSFAKAFPMILLAIIALTGNALVLASVSIFKSLRRLPGNMFIVNLAVTDVIGASACMPLAVSAFINGDWVFGDCVCQFQAFLIVSLSNVTFLTLFSYSVFRYYMVTSTRQPTRTTLWKVVKVTFALIWTIGLTVSIFPLVGLGRYEYIPTFYACTLDWTMNKAYSASVFVVVFFIPQIVMVFSYYRISQFVRRHKRQISKRRKNNAVSNFKPTPENPHENDAFSSREENNSGPARGIGNRKRLHFPLPTIVLQLPEADSDPMVLFTKRSCFQSTAQTNPRAADGPRQRNPTTTALNPNTTSVMSPSPSMLDLRENLRSPCLSMTHIYIDQEDPPEPRFEDITLPSNLSRFQKPIFSPTELNMCRPKPARPTVNMKRMFRETRLIKLLLFTVLAFYVCWTPFAVSSFLQTVGYLEVRPPHFDVASMWLAFLNTICNPLIYALFNSQFRKAFRKVLRVCFCCHTKRNRIK